MRIPASVILLAVILSAQHAAAQSACSWAGTTSQYTSCSVGVGSTNTPLEKLHVMGDSPAVRIEDLPGTGVPRLLLFTGGSERAALEADLNGTFRLKTNGGTRLAVVQGNLGIGTTSPDARTTIQGDSGRQLSFKDANGNTRLFVQAEHGAGAYYYDFNSGNYDLRLTSARSDGSGGNIGFWTANPPNSALAERLRITPEGRVQVFRTGLFGGEGGSAGSVRVVIGASPGDYGTVGYNAMPTASPNVYEYNGDDFASQVRFDFGGFRFRTAPRRGENPPNNTIAFTDVVTILQDGNVGIGYTSPTHKLHVNGNAHFNGTVTGTNIKAHFQDLAEWVPASEALAPGMVVILDKTANNTVAASKNAYDTSVAGVVSPQPGISLGEEGPDKVQVATTGRVRVRVDATRGAVAIGDLLVTSDVPGTAMRSEPMEINGRRFHQPGTVIGKALEPLTGGVGEILVLLSLQ